MNNKGKISIYTDGACSGNPGPGGWAVVIGLSSGIEKISGGSKETTNNRMELMAYVEALKYIYDKKIKKADIYSDSAYVVNSINNKWIKKWVVNGWKTSGRKEVKNKDLWEMQIKICEAIKLRGVKINLIKVKGHAGNALNEYADELAKSEILKG